MEKFLAWQKSILLISVFLSVVFMFILVFLTPIASKDFSTSSPPSTWEIVRLSLAGGVGFFLIFSFFNFASTLFRFLKGKMK